MYILYTDVKDDDDDDLIKTSSQFVWVESG